MNKLHIDGVKCPFRVRNNSKIRRKKKLESDTVREIKQSDLTSHFFVAHQLPNKLPAAQKMIYARLYNVQFSMSKIKKAIIFLMVLYNHLHQRGNYQRRGEKSEFPHAREAESCRCKKGWLVKKEGVMHYLISCANSHAK